jgi:hypothetical protein
MKTRNDGFYVNGFYKQLNENIFSKTNGTESKKSLKMCNIQNLINSINFNILSKLFSTRKKEPTIKFKINIENKVFEFLSQNFGLNAKYRECENFISQYKIKTMRCTNTKYFSFASNINLKINRGRTMKYQELKETGVNGVCQRSISSNPTISVMFLKVNRP